MPAFWPAPMKLNPPTVNSASMFFVLEAEEVMLDGLATSTVRGSVAPAGSVQITIASP